MSKMNKALKSLIILVMTALFTILFTIVLSVGQAQDEGAIEHKIDGFPVTLGDQTLFVIQVEVGSFSSQERSQVISQRIGTIAEDLSLNIQNLEIENQAEVSNLIFGQNVVMTITEADAQAARENRRELAENYRQTIVEAVTHYRQERSAAHLIRGVLYTLLFTLILLLSLLILGQIFPRLYQKIEIWQDTRIPSLRIQNLELIPAQQVAQILIASLKLVRWAIVLTLFYLYIPSVLSFFPWTRRFSNSLFQYLWDTLGQIGLAFLNYLPNLFILILIMAISYYATQLIRFVFHQLAQGHIAIPGFYPEWAEPTSKLSVFLIFALAIVIAFPYLPGFNSPAFQGVTIFFGVLFSLGSTAAIANVVAGVILIYTRAFQIGDRIKIAETVGDVEEKTLLVTRIRTPKNALVTIPNGAVLSSNIINFSASVRDTNTPLIVHTTITLGYDIPWRKVHEVLVAAAHATTDILDDPPPFVLQTGLNDFYVSYEINAYTERSQRLPRIYSELHAHIQDHCNEAEIEILSPHYASIRDGHHTTIPEDYLPEDYAAPGFRLDASGPWLDRPPSPPQKD